MKIVFLFLLFAVGCSHIFVNAEPITITITDEHLSQEFITKILGDLLIHRIVEKRQEQLGIIPVEKDARLPIIPFPPIPNIPILDYRFDLENDLIEGFYEHWDSSLQLDIVDDLFVHPVDSNLTLGYKLDITEIALRGNYNTDLVLNFTYLKEIIDIPIIGPELIPISGEGEYEIALKNFELGLSVEVAFKQGTVEIESIRVALIFSLGGIHIRFQDLMLNGFPFDDGLWDAAGELLTFLINGQLLTPIKTTLEELIAIFVQDALDLLVGCNLQEIIGGDISCIIGTGPTQPTQEPTTTTPRPTPPGDTDGANPKMATSVTFLLTTLSLAAIFMQ